MCLQLEATIIFYSDVGSPLFPLPYPATTHMNLQTL